MRIIVELCSYARGPKWVFLFRGPVYYGVSFFKSRLCFAFQRGRSEE